MNHSSQIAHLPKLALIIFRQKVDVNDSALSFRINIPILRPRREASGR
jgi:hypothetical protein